MKIVKMKAFEDEQRKAGRIPVKAVKPFILNGDLIATGAWGRATRKLIIRLDKKGFVRCSP